MGNRYVGLARPIPEEATDVPATCEIRVQYEGTINQRHHGADILAEIGQRQGGIHEDTRIVATHLQGSPRETGALEPVPLPVFAPIGKNQPNTADRGPGECGPVTRIALDLLLHKTESLRDSRCR